MGFDSNGTFNRAIPGGWVSDATADIKIRADRHDLEDDGFATGLSTCITKDGRTQPTANIPMNGKKIVNHGDITAGDAASTVATKGYVDSFKAFTTGLNVSGAGPINGFINFTAPSGVNGIGWTTADMSWIGRIEEAGKTRKRLAVNDAKDGTGSDVAIVDEAGKINNSGWLTNNLSHDGTSWRTIGAGTGTAVQYAGGDFYLHANDTATTVAYQVATLRNYLHVNNNAGTTFLDLIKSASGKTVQVRSFVGTEARWSVILGHSDAESADRKGSSFYLQSFNNSGINPVNEIAINRETHLLTTAGGITAAGTITSGANFDSTSTACVLSATNSGSISLRPDGPTVTTSAMNVDTNGNVAVCNALAAATGGVQAGKGLRSKAGTTGAYDANWMNLQYSGGFVYVWTNTSNMGAITWQSDYRIKRDINPLPSTWQAVKALFPITYKHRKYLDLTEDEDTVRWGFLAHQLQETLTPSAAFGHKDEENVVQSVNPLTVIAALTRALQEAMERIEALEARA